MCKRYCISAAVTRCSARSVYVRIVLDGPVSRYHCRCGTRYQRPCPRCSSSHATAANGADPASPSAASRSTRTAAEAVECTPGNAAVASSVNRPRFIRQNSSAEHDRFSTRRLRAYANFLFCVCLFAVRKSSTTYFCTVRPRTHSHRFASVFEFPLQVASRSMRTFQLTALAVRKTSGPHPPGVV